MNNLSTTCEGGRFFPAWTIVFDERSVDNSDDDDDDDYHFWEHLCQPKILDFSSVVFLDWICTNSYGCANGFNPIDYQLLVLLLITCNEFCQGVLLVGNYQLVEIDHYQIFELVHVPAIELTFTKVLYSSLSYVYHSIRWTHWCRISFFVGLCLVFLADMGLIAKWGAISVSLSICQEPRQYLKRSVTKIRMMRKTTMTSQQWQIWRRWRW